MLDNPDFDPVIQVRFLKMILEAEITK